MFDDEISVKVKLLTVFSVAAEGNSDDSEADNKYCDCEDDSGHEVGVRYNGDPTSYKK